MSTASRAFLLGPLLKGVSRSFYLTLRVLPAGMRDPIGLAYLLARAADTIADTSLIAPPRRLELLLALRTRVNGGTAADAPALQQVASEVARHQQQSDEKTLLESLEPALAILTQLDDADRAAVRGIVTTLSEGMEFDLRTFPDEQSGQLVALREMTELDRYTYLVAGCVGEFWTRMTCLHLPGTLKAPEVTMLERGVRFGQALQMTNVLRDCAKDLRIGRCYLPSVLLARHGLQPADLLAHDASLRARPVLIELTRVALAQFHDALDYTLAIPRLSLRLRLACIWPVVIGLETLSLLVDNKQWLDPAQPSKVRRNDVYRTIVRSLPSAPSDTLLRGWVGGLIDGIEGKLARAG